MPSLHVALFATSDANHTAHMNDYIAGARAMLKKHGIGLEIMDTTNGAGGARILPYTGAVFNGPGDPGSVRQQCHVAVPQGFGIPVIFCKRNMDNAASGGIELGSMIPKSNHQANSGVGWLPYVLINTQGKSTANEVLLHELIHAAYDENQPNKPGDPHDRDPSSCFYGYGTTPDGGPLSGSATRHLPDKHAAALRKAYFYKP
jgi:hypothetical protein